MSLQFRTCRPPSVPGLRRLVRRGKAIPCGVYLAHGPRSGWAQAFGIAREEGFEQIAILMEGVAAIEKGHEERYLKLLANIKEGKVFARNGVYVWKCSNCGHIHIGETAPQLCPVCAHPQAYFEIKAENY